MSGSTESPAFSGEAGRSVVHSTSVGETLQPPAVPASGTRRRDRRTRILSYVALGTFLLLLPLTAQVFLRWQTAPAGPVTPHLLLLHFVSYFFIGISESAVGAMILQHMRRTGGRTHAAYALLGIGVLVVITSIIQLVAAIQLTETAIMLALESRVIAQLTFVAIAIFLPVTVPALLESLRSDAALEERRSLISSRNDLQFANAALELEIQERRRAEEISSANLLRLRATLDSLPMGAVVIDEHDIVIHMNRRCPEVLHLDGVPETFVGRPAREYFGAVARTMHDPDEYLRNLDQRMPHREPFTTAELHLRDGRIIQKETTRIIAEHQPRGALILYRDITRERRVDASKSEFMSLASHQLRTPLTAIRWALGRLTKTLAGRLEPAEKALLGEGRVAATRMAHTIDTMLAISRIEAGHVRAERVETKLGALLNEVRVDCRELADGKRQHLTLDCAPNLLLQTDPHILKEILQNLYTNAIKYTPEGGHIRVSGSLHGGTVRISVQDDGYGIPRHQQEKIFRKFFRADNIVGTDTEGTGLGLYLVALLVQMLGGQISFVSAENRGTTFTLDIPSGAGQTPSYREPQAARA